MKNIKTIVFLSGTRADYGKLKPLIKVTQKYFDSYVYVCGMHLSEQYGNTYKDILEDGFDNIYRAIDINFSKEMDINLARTIISLNKYIKNINPDLIVVHGDRIEALAGAISGMLNNILIAHIEGGEITGTIDETIRHAISKMAQYHFVANYESKIRLLQLGENKEKIYVIGSPDIDIMLSELPSINEIKIKYNIPFNDYAIFIYHPVTTEISSIHYNISQIIKAIEESKKNYIIIYPNNDLGSQIIINEIEKLKDKDRYIIFRSLPFEDFLSLLKNAVFMIGNSSAGIREACVYGIPTIDIGTRQNGRYQKTFLKNIQHTVENKDEILKCINHTIHYKFTSNYFGEGKSACLFADILKSLNVAPTTQKKFIDTSETQKAIQNYINEVCF